MSDCELREDAFIHKWRLMEELEAQRSSKSSPPALDDYNEMQGVFQTKTSDKIHNNKTVGAGKAKHPPTSANKEELHGGCPRIHLPVQIL